MPKILQSDIQTGDTLYQWVVEEYVQYERNSAWYIFMISLGLILVLYGIFSNNFIFALIIILVGIILFLQSHQQPLPINFQIAELGVIVGNRFYSYDELVDFYIMYNPPEVKMLFIETNNPLRPRLRIPLMDMNPVEIRSALLAFLPENTEVKEEPLSDMIARRFRLL